MSRSLSVIARDVRKNWVNKAGTPSVNFGAKPYLDAMSQLDSIHDSYYADSAASVVRYFLANASSFRGEDARRIKAELNSMLKAA